MPSLPSSAHASRPIAGAAKCSNCAASGDDRHRLTRCVKTCGVVVVIAGAGGETEGAEQRQAADVIALPAGGAVWKGRGDINHVQPHFVTFSDGYRRNARNVIIKGYRCLVAAMGKWRMIHKNVSDCGCLCPLDSCSGLANVCAYIAIKVFVFVGMVFHAFVEAVGAAVQNSLAMSGSDVHG